MILPFAFGISSRKHCFKKKLANTFIRNGNFMAVGSWFIMQYHNNPIIKISSRKKTIPAPKTGYINISRLPLEVVNWTSAPVTLTFSVLQLSLSDGSWQKSLKTDIFSAWLKFSAISARASGELLSPER